MASSGSPGDVYTETLAVFDRRDDTSEPLTTPEVADSLDAARRTVYKRLEKLVNRGDLKTKKVGANARIWWPPIAGPEHQAHVADNQHRRDEFESTVEEVLERISDGFYGLDEDFKFTYINDHAQDLLYLEESSALGEDIHTVFRLTDEFEAALHEAHETREPVFLKDYYEPFDTWYDNAIYPSETGLSVYFHDITERKRLEHDLRIEKEHFRIALENSPFTAFRLDTDLRYTWIGNPHEDFDAEAVIGKRDDELLPEEAAEIILEPKRQVLKTGEPVREVLTYELLSGIVTYDLTVEPLRDESGEIVAVTCAALDITERKKLELTLTRLHEASRNLIQATTRVEVSQRTVDTAADVFDASGVGIYLFDDTDNTLNLAASTGALKAAFETTPAVGPGDASSAWQAFVNDETISHDAGDEAVNGGLTETPAQHGLWIPINDHGVLALITEEAGGISEQTREVADHLAATAQATFERIEREESLREQEQEQARQNRRLKDLKKVTDIIREIDTVLVQSKTPAEVKQAVCDRLTQNDRFAFAWIGGTTDKGLTPQTWAGEGRGYLDEISLSLDADSGDPALETVKTGELSSVPNVSARLREEPWRKAALARGLQSILSIPIQYDQMNYGTLTVYAGEIDAFDSLTREVVAELGTTIAHALHAAEVQRTLLTDSFVEFELLIREADTVLQHLATTADCQIAVRGTVPQQRDETRVFVTVRDCPPERFESVAKESTRVAYVERLDNDSASEGRQFEIVVKSQAIPSTIAQYGGIAREILVTPSETRIVTELPRSTDIRTFINRLDETFPETELVSRRDTERDGDSSAQRELLLSDQTGRQREVLQTAFLSGYFEWPREKTGEEVAESLGITQSTFNNHLRASERKMLMKLFG